MWSLHPKGELTFLFMLCLTLRKHPCLIEC